MDRTTSRYRERVILGADGGEYGANEKAEIRRALSLQMARIGKYPSRFVLRVVVELVGHEGVVVTNTAAYVDGNLLADPLATAGRNLLSNNRRRN